MCPEAECQVNINSELREGKKMHRTQDHKETKLEMKKKKEEGRKTTEGLRWMRSEGNIKGAIIKESGTENSKI